MIEKCVLIFFGKFDGVFLGSLTLGGFLRWGNVSGKRILRFLAKIRENSLRYIQSKQIFVWKFEFSTKFRRS